MEIVEAVDWLIRDGIVEGDGVLTLINLLRSHLEGLITAEEMLREIDSFKSEFYEKLLRR
jgi:hypothetical protein